MRMYDIILKKRQGVDLSRIEIDYFIKGCVDGTIPDYQVSALLMAIFFKGLSRRETTDLTMSMFGSGDTVDLSAIPGIKVDKHSTGGVGDKTTLVLGPLVASAGVTVAKMSGRGLGHTGGTIDKLESIPGFRVEMDNTSFIQQVREIGLAVVAQTGNLVPADKKLYALRDVTATVDKIELIASSVMSKKLASGADAIVLDVKVGSGAFMKSLEEAADLAGLMVEIGSSLGRRTAALLTTMDQPLGMAVGNALEVKEAIETLSDRGPQDLREVCLALGSEMLVLAGKVRTAGEAESLLVEKLKNGMALKKFGDMIERQGGSRAVLENTSLLPEAPLRKTVTAGRDGYLTEIDALKIGHCAMILGAGRETRESSIDLSAGIVMHKKNGQTVKRGEVLATLHYSPGKDPEGAEHLAESAFTIGDSPPEKQPTILKRISGAQK